MSITIDDLDNIFAAHLSCFQFLPGCPTEHYAMQKAANSLGRAIFVLCPDNRERSLAIDRLREAVMWANTAIACNEFEE